MYTAEIIPDRVRDRNAKANAMPSSFTFDRLEGFIGEWLEGQLLNLEGSTCIRLYIYALAFKVRAPALLCDIYTSTHKQLGAHLDSLSTSPRPKSAFTAWRVTRQLAY